jgi:hypothetical protein
MIFYVHFVPSFSLEDTEVGIFCQGISFLTVNFYLKLQQLKKVDAACLGPIPVFFELNALTKFCAYAKFTIIQTTHGEDETMNTATMIKEEFGGDFEECMVQADMVACDADQDWEEESTTFHFDDGSHLYFCHPEIKVVGK